MKNVSTIFKVTSICMAPQAKNAKNQDGAQSFASSENNQSFTVVLDNAIRQAADDALSCRTCTYDANRRLQNFFYQPKEYTY